MEYLKKLKFKEIWEEIQESEVFLLIFITVTPQ